MSAALFTKNKNTSNNARSVKKLLISLPIRTPALLSPVTPLTPTFGLPRAAPTVVLRAKYSFHAQSLPEISIRQDEYVKHVDRPGNGWLMVQCIDRYACGLVPALYVEIAVNDAKFPVLADWLNAVNDSSSDWPTTAAVEHVLVNPAQQVWYRLDLAMHSGQHVFCAKQFEDFVDLHYSLQDKFGDHAVPRVPAAPARSVTALKDADAAGKEHLATAKALHAYMADVLANPLLQESAILLDFVTDTHTPRLVLAKGQPVPSSTHLSDALHKGSVVVGTPRKHSFSPTAPLPPVTVLLIPRSPLSKEVLQYLSSNLKYLSYLNQLGPALPKKQGRQGMPESGSSQTISSFSSLISTYNQLSIDEEQDVPAPASPQLLRRIKSPHSLASSCENTTVNSMAASTGPARTHYTSLSLDLGLLIKAVEPRTPTLDNLCHFDQRYKFVVPEPILRRNPDFDLSPLQPKMHRELLLGFEDSQWNVLPRNPARRSNS